MDLRGERRNLDRDIDPGDFAAVIAVDQFNFCPPSRRLRKRVDQFEIAVLIPVCFGLAHDCFAEDIDGESERFLAHPPELRDRFRCVAREDKSFGHLRDTLAGRPAN